MQPTKKMVLLSLLGIVFIIVASFVYMYRPAFILYNIVLIIVGIVDYRMTVTDFEITRDDELKLSLFAEEEITFEVYNKSEKDLEIYIKDTPIDYSFEWLSDHAYGIVEPHEKGKMTYKLMPKKRGIYTVVNVYAKVVSPLGLIHRHFVYEIPATFKVYPNIKDVSKYRLMVYDGLMVRGSKKIYNKRGDGLEYESLREYIPGDAYKRINWKATAARNKPIVNIFDVEKNQDIITLIDSGKALSYEVHGYKKLDLAINTSLILADIANSSGDKSGLMVFNEEVQQYVGPGSGAAHRNKLLETLYTIDYNRNVSNFHEAFKYLNTMHKKRSILFMFTEFETMDEAAEYLKVLPQVAKRHLVILFMMTKEKVVALTKNHSTSDQDLFIKGAAFDLLNERKAIIKKLRQHKIMVVECLPETLTMNVVNYYITLKGNNML